MDDDRTEWADDDVPYDPANPADRAALLAIAAGTGDGYGTADASPDGIDRSQLRRNLSLSPEERLRQMTNATRVLLKLQGTAKRRPRP